jgi:hypothetical protein
MVLPQSSWAIAIGSVLLGLIFGVDVSPLQQLEKKNLCRDGETLSIAI